MTKNELSQQNSEIIKAGKTAYNIGVQLVSNPYKKSQQFFKLWKIGWTQGKKQDDRKKLNNGRYRTYLEKLIETPWCIKCNLPVTAQPESNESYCNRCGDTYYHTEFEILEEK